MCGACEVGLCESSSPAQNAFEFDLPIGASNAAIGLVKAERLEPNDWLNPVIVNEQVAFESGLLYVVE